MKRKSFYIIFILILAVGLGFLLYPTISDKVNSVTQSRVVSTYADNVEKLSDEEYEELESAAEAFNASIPDRTPVYELSDAEQEEYQDLLDIDGTGVMGYVDIPSIDCTLPIYHGTDESALQNGIGHLEWTSLPVGGESTHCVISGHRGLPSSKLFTDLDLVEIGDTFTLHVLNETLTYEVDQILTVEPEDIDDLQIVEGEDLCTLMTCTPYGINTHRLLIRGHRVPNEDVSGNVVSNAMLVDPLIVASVLGAIFLIVVFVVLGVTGRRRKHTKVNTHEKDD